MSKVNQLIKARHTTRLMKESMNEVDIQTILDSARRAPSKNKIYGYKIFALTESTKGKKLKNELCDHVTLYKEDDTTIYLLQTKAPLVLVYMANPAPEHQMVGVNEKIGEQVFDKDYSEVTSKVSQAAMIKSSVRDAMISATYAQLTAEDLGYGTAFVACGLEDIMANKQFIRLWAEEFGDNYASKPMEPVVILCIGSKHEKIIDLFQGTSTEAEEPYLDGETHYKRSGREESFLVNVKQQSMIVEI